jgi:hypothetical protein
MIFMTMKEVRDEMAKQFLELGFSMNAGKDKANITLYLSGGSGIKFRLENGNPKKFEIHVTGDRQEFNVPPDKIYDAGGGEYETFERFRKTEDGIRAFVPWLARVKTSHKSLLEIIEPSNLTPPAYFKDGEYEITDKGYVSNGALNGVRITGIVTIGAKNRLISAAEPGVDAWFMANVNLANSTYTIITEGTKYYPVVQVNVEGRSVNQIYPDANFADNLAGMNARDKRLITKACEEYVKKLVSVEGKPDEEE